jgi:nitrogen fixation NifU-like protein
MEEKTKNGIGTKQQHHAKFWRHAQFPVNTQPLNQTNGLATGVGSCGDKVTIHIVVQRDCIEAIRQIPEGCLYTTACASAVSALAIGRSPEKALEIQPEDVEIELGGLPEDHRHCARLAVNTLGEAIADYYRAVLQSRPTQTETDRGNSHANL